MEVEEGRGRGGVEEVGGGAAEEGAEVVGVRGGSGGGGGVGEGGGGEGAGGRGEEEDWGDCLTAMMSPSGGFCKLRERERREKSKETWRHGGKKKRSLVFSVQLV